MNPPTEPVQTTVNADLRSRRDTRLHGPWLVFFRSTWIILSIFAMLIFIESLPVYLSNQLKSYSFSYSIFLLALSIFVSLVWFIVAVLIFWRKSNDWMALLVSFMLVLQGVNTTINPLDNIPSLWQMPALITNLLAFDLLFLVFCLFPNGRFVPRWIGWLAVMFAVLPLGTFIVDLFDLLPNFFNLFLTLAVFFFLGSFVVAQLYRYHSVSSRTERQQTKWIVFGVTATYLIEFANIFCSYFFPSFFSTGSLPAKILLPISNVAPILIPLSFGFAVLHSRLWDIDIIIHRTMVYSTLTVVLAVIYEVSIFTLQSVLGGFVRGNQLAIIASTFLIGTLFKPVHGRTQALIDRRFYRRKYDAAKTIEAFAADLRNEVDLKSLTEHLVAVVQETMQPAYISLWLCPPKRYSEKTTQALPIMDSVSEP